VVSAEAEAVTVSGCTRSRENCRQYFDERACRTRALVAFVGTDVSQKARAFGRHPCSYETACADGSPLASIRAMLRMICLGAAVSCSALACGGAIQQDDATDGGGAAPKASPTATAPFGTWELVALDGMPGGNGSTQTSGHLVLELRQDGNAIARRCTNPYYESDVGGFRCADASAYDCAYGTVTRKGENWRVDIPDLRAPSKTARGEVIVGDNDGIVIRYILPKYAAGHFVRATDAPPASLYCAGP
jgi:hypothetical protein